METWRQFDGKYGTWLDGVLSASVEVGRLAAVIPNLRAGDLGRARAGCESFRSHRATYDLFVVLLPIVNRATRAVSAAPVAFFWTDRALVTLRDERLSAAALHALSSWRTQPLSEVRSTLLARLATVSHGALDALTETPIAGTPRLRAQERVAFEQCARLARANERWLDRETTLPNVDAVRAAYRGLANRADDLANERFPDRPPVSDVEPRALVTALPRWYATIAAIILALALVASTFGLGARLTPLAQRPGLFWLIGAPLVLIALGVVEYLRKRQWL